MIHARDRGLLSTELAILMPVLFLFALLSIYVVHVERHSSRAQQAADAAARAASLASDESTALAAAQAAAELVCRGAVTITGGGWSYDAPDAMSFTPGRVSVGLTCTESFTTFAPLVESHERVEAGAAVSVIEYWRAGP